MKRRVGCTCRQRSRMSRATAVIDGHTFSSELGRDTPLPVAGKLLTQNDYPALYGELRRGRGAASLIVSRARQLHESALV
jgi:hypothetical protein